MARERRYRSAHRADEQKEPRRERSGEKVNKEDKEGEVKHR